MTFGVWFALLACFVLLAGIVGATGYYFYVRYVANNHWKPLLQKELQQLVLKTSDSLYHIEYSDFDLNMATRSATLHDFRLVPDTNVYKKLVALKKAPDNLFILSVKKLKVTNLNARKAYKEKILDIDDIIIDNPELTVINRRFDFNDTVKVGKAKTPYEIIKPIFKQLQIESIALNNVSLKYIDKNNRLVKENALNRLDIKVTDITIDSLSAKDPTRFYYTRDVAITIHDYHINTPDGLYKTSLGKIFFSTAQRKIELDKIAFVPRYAPNSFYRKKGGGGDIFTLKFDRIAINGVDLQRFLRAQKLFAGTMDVSNPDISIYHNSAFNGKSAAKVGNDPHQALQRASLDLHLARLNISNANIRYAETNTETGGTGEIMFTHTNGYFLNLTNDSASKRRNPLMVARINTRFMDAAPLQVNFKFNLAARNGAFNYSGELGKFDGRVLDKLVKPLAKVHVESADVEKLRFNVDANNYSGKGNLEFYYQNLKIDLLKKTEGKPELQKQAIVTMVANNLIIQHNNPNKSGVFRPGPIDLQREPTTSFFSFLYKALLDGLKPSVGYDKKTENKVNSAIVKVNSLVGNFNNYMAERKKKREEKKAKKDSIKQTAQNNGN